jgi:ketosteroid isomerase-like protein
MKNKILKGGLTFVIVLLMIACNQKKEETSTTPITVDKDQIKADLQVLETAFAEAMNLRSTANIIYYDNDATNFGQNKPPLVGKDAIDKSLREENATMPKGSKVSYMVNEVFPSSDGNQVVEIGSYQLVDSTDTVKSSGNYMSLFEKRDGKYVCIRDMSASIMPIEKK